MEKENNCYNCKHSRRIAGDCHISCDNELVRSLEPQIVKITMMTGMVGLNSIISKFGIQSLTDNINYFFFPSNYDPVWITGNCTNHSNLLKEESMLMLLESGQIEVSGVPKNVLIAKLKDVIAEKRDLIATA